MFSGEWYEGEPWTSWTSIAWTGIKDYGTL